MRISENKEKNLTIVIVMTLILSLFCAIMSPIGLLRRIFAYIFILTIVGTIVGLPILALWPTDKDNWIAIKNKIFKRHGRKS